MGRLTYRCIKDFEIPIVDEDGEFTDESAFIVTDSLYEMQEPQGMTLTGADYRLNLVDGNGLGWIEISEERLNDNFKLERY